MGNRQSLNPAIPVFHSQEWQQIQSMSPQHPQYGHYKVYRHVENGKLIDQFEMTFNDEEDYKNYLRSCIWRLHESQIVNTLYIKQQHKEEFCSTTYCIKVYLQHIDTRLSDITDIPYPQNLYVALSALDGFHKLHEQLDYFKIEENQICVDQNGHIRVWVNSDLSKNYPSIDEDYHNGDETIMVYQIMSIITENTDRDSQPQSLKEYFFDRGGDKIGFQDAQIIISEYIRKHNAQVPQCFQSILQIYRKQQESQENNEQGYTNDQQNNMNPNNYNQFHMVNRSYNDGQGHVGQVGNSGHVGNVSINQSNSFHYHPQQQKNSQIFKPWQANQILHNQSIHNKNHHYSNIEETKGLNHNPSQRSISNVHRPNFHIQSRIPQPQANPLGFLPTYNPLPASPHIVQTHIVQHPPYNPVNQSPYQSSMVRYFSPQHSPHYHQIPPHINIQRVNIPFETHQKELAERQHQNIENHGFNNQNIRGAESIPQQQQLNNKFNNSKHKDGSNPYIKVVPPISQHQFGQNIRNSKSSFREKMQRSENASSAKQNRSYKNVNMNQYDHRLDRQHVTISNAFSNDNSHVSRPEIQRSKDVRIEQASRSLSNQNVYTHNHEEHLTIPQNSSSGHKHQDTDKTFYYTLCSEQQLDPEIAADLKKMFEEF